MVAVAIFSFILLDLSPINPVSVYLKGAAVSEAQRQILNQYFGVGVPLPTKIYHWLLDLIQGNLGTSLIYRAPVIDVILDKFTASLALMSISWLLSGIIGFLLVYLCFIINITIVNIKFFKLNSWINFIMHYNK